MARGRVRLVSGAIAPASMYATRADKAQLALKDAAKSSKKAGASTKAKVTASAKGRTPGRQ